jgi:hypothetical protein
MEKTVEGNFQAECKECFEIILKKMIENPQIESKIWISVFVGFLANGYRNTESTYENCCQNLDDIKEFYKTIRGQKEEMGETFDLYWGEP